MKPVSLTAGYPPLHSVRQHFRGVMIATFNIKLMHNGFYLKHRCIQQSSIAHKAPVVREVWDWLLMNANFSELKHNGRSLVRGQQFTSIRAIREGLFWYVGYAKKTYSERQTRDAMKYLMNEGMIVTTKVTNGIIVTICNYGKYQDIFTSEGKGKGKGEGESVGNVSVKEGRNNIEQGKQEEQGKQGNNIEESFDVFYSAYPKKKNRKDAKIKYKNTLKKKLATHDEIMNAVNLYNQEISIQRTDKQFIKSPDVWLNKECWDDEYDLTDYEPKKRATNEYTLADATEQCHRDIEAEYGTGSKNAD